MNPEPLPRTLYDKAKKLKLANIILEFSGGSDEGYLSVCLTPSNHPDDEPNPALDAEIDSFSDEVEEWAWSVYDYSGAGDGSDYGDDITYDLVEGKVTYSEWAMVREDQPVEEMKLKCVNEQNDNP
jgi:hypothetical protein